MKVICILLVVIIASVRAGSFFKFALDKWQSFKNEYQKFYNAIDDPFRMDLFIQSRSRVEKHNSKYEKGLVPYKIGLNKFSDMLRDELVQINGFNKSRPVSANYHQNIIKSKFIAPENVELPKSIDWREKGAVTPVKDQGQCSSCWAFSATGSLEGQQFRHSGKLVSLSEQNLIDCSSGYGNEGCNGGLMDNAFRYVKENGGIDTEFSYQYQSENGECRYSSSNRGAQGVGYIDIESGVEEKLKAAVATIGSISAAIDATHDSIFGYSEGIYHEPECSSTEVDHAVLVVGYGTDEKGNDYWLIKNSWGKKWGEEGYMKMARNKNNHCGIATQAIYPLII